MSLNSESLIFSKISNEIYFQFAYSKSQTTVLKRTIEQQRHRQQPNLQWLQILVCLCLFSDTLELTKSQTGLKKVQECKKFRQKCEQYVTPKSEKKSLRYPQKTICFPSKNESRCAKEQTTQDFFGIYAYFYYLKICIKNYARVYTVRPTKNCSTLFLEAGRAQLETECYKKSWVAF